MMEPVTKNKEIITTCPICKQEIRIGQLVFYHPGDNVFYHSKCLERTENDKTIGSGTGSESSR